MTDSFRLLIVGGGSAGWMAAAYLNAALRDNGQREVEITLIESPDTPRIGVGEATIPSINHILAVVGLEPLDFMRRVDGTFKQSIRYTNWLHGKGDFYHHPFSRIRFSPVDQSAPTWLASDRSIPFTETVSSQAMVCELGLGPKPLQVGGFDPGLTFAYHMNALKFADHLCEIATARGVRHFREHVADVQLDLQGNIQAVTTKQGQRHEADLFIDCTGFTSRLLHQALGVDWVDCSQWLLCDRATTMHVPYEHHYPGRVNPYTSATALSSGWVWEIPLQNKKSLGYVHSSDFIDDDAAERELRQFEGSHSESLDSRIVRFQVGHRRQPWVKNCIAIGLAGSFIEPLESTGLYLSDLATVMLAQHFPLAGDMDAQAWRFNRILLNRFYEILDFINMHYCLTQRRDSPFWQEIRRPERVNPRLQAKLDFWRVKPPSPSDFEDQWFPGQPEFGAQRMDQHGDGRSPIDTAGLWNHESYEAILYGMDFLRAECDQWYGTQRPKSQVPQFILRQLKQASQHLPAHADWLQRNVGMQRYPTTGSTA